MATAAGTQKRYYWLAGRREDAQDRYFREALDPALWAPGDAETWDTCWYTGMPAPADFDRLTAHKWVNHIPGNNAVTIKSRLAESLYTTRERMIAEEGPGGEGVRRLQFIPDTYPMPRAYHAFQADALAEPGRRWILKPKNMSRGRDIALVRDAATVPSDSKWMVQRYLDDPHTIRGHKYVLRLYVLITAVEPLRIYLFEEGFAKLASEPYDLDAPFNVFAHLTNPDINATNEASSAPVVFIPLDTYRTGLRAQGHDDAALMSKLRDLVAITAISAREHMRRRLAEVKADTTGCYEILGLDCLVDAQLNPWILECNLSPSFDVCCAPQDGGTREGEIKRQIVTDAVAMLGLNRPYRDLSGLDPERQILAQAEEEMAYRGGWQRVFPGADPEAHLGFFALPRLADMVLADAVAGAPVERPVLRPHRCAEVIGDDRMAVYAEQTGKLYHFNETAAWLWLTATAGKSPDEMAEALAGLRGVSDPQGLWAVRREVWDQLADWAELGLLCKARDTTTQGRVEIRSTPQPASSGTRPPPSFTIRAGERNLRIVPASEAARARLAPLLGALTSEADEAETDLEILESPRGYTLACDGKQIATDTLLAGIAPRTCDLILAQASHGALVGTLDGALVALASQDGGPLADIFVAPGQGSTGQSSALELSQALAARFARGLRLGATRDDDATSLGLPARITESVFERLTEQGFAPVRQDGAAHEQIFPDGRRGRLVPASLAGPSRPASVSAVLVLHKARKQRAERTLNLLSPSEALAALLPGYRAAGNATPTAKQVEALAQWLEGRALWSLAIDQPDAAAQALLEALAPTAPAARPASLA